MVNNDINLLERIINNEDITSEDLGRNPNIPTDCSTTIEYGCKIFYTNGVSIYDSSGKLVSKRMQKKLGY